MELPRFSRGVEARKGGKGGKGGKGIDTGAAAKEAVGGMMKKLAVISIATGAIVKLMKILVKSSPVLGAVMELFQLAFTLFFMPFGNAIGKGLLPLAMLALNSVLWFHTKTDGGRRRI